MSTDNKMIRETETQGIGTQGGSSIGDQVLPYGERAKSIFEKLEDWTPAQFKNAVALDEAKLLRDPQGRTVLHRAVETGNIALVELLHNEYGFVGTLPDNQGKTAIDLATEQGDDFMGVFGDVKPPGVAV